MHFAKERIYIKTKTAEKSSFTAAIGTIFKRKEFSLRKQEMKLRKEGCCSSLHVLFIIQTPLLPAKGDGQW